LRDKVLNEMNEIYQSPTEDLKLVSEQQLRILSRLQTLVGVGSGVTGEGEAISIIHSWLVGERWY
jgi:hypothetical protein